MSCLIGVSSSTISREIRFLLPRVVTALDYIKFPENYQFEELGCNGAVDGTVHRRNRPPHQQHYYSGCYGFHCLHILATSGLNGEIFDIVISPGSQTDQQVFRLSTTRDIYIRNLEHSLIEDLDVTKRQYSYH